LKIRRHGTARLVRLAALAFACAAALAAAPAITGVYNNSSFAPPGLPNSGIAQGSIFAVKGSGLGPSTLLEVSGYPWPSTQGLAGTTVQVTVGSVTKTCIMIYSWDLQVAAVLPSATPVGTGTLTLTYQGAKVSTSIQVVAANFGSLTLNGGGTGPGVITDGSYNVITMVNPAHPGDTLVLWGTGLGAVTGDETVPPPQYDLGSGAQVFVGNQPATVWYGGRSNYPGVDQINFTVPPGTAGGCKVSIAVVVKGVTGNVTTASIAPVGQTTCSDTFGMLTSANLQKAVAKGSLNVGGIGITRIGSVSDSLLAYFGNFPLNSIIRSNGGSYIPSAGSCTALEGEGSSPEAALVDPIEPTYLNAGPNLVVTGPGGSKTVPADSTGYYSATLATPPSVYIAPGTYSVGNGSGGSGVGAFTAGLTLPAPVVPTSLPASVNRAQNLTLNWTGSAGFHEVGVFAFNGVPVTFALNSYVFVLCNASASSGSFTIPSTFLNLLAPDGYGATGQHGVNLQIVGIPESPFTAPGIDTGVLTVFTTNGSIATLK
jgi:uncharacterized protein (TIGR03437 family)